MDGPDADQEELAGSRGFRTPQRAVYLGALCHVPVSRQPLALALRELRHERATLSQEGLATLAGVHRTYLGTLERGDALGVSVSEVVGRAEDRAGR